LSSIVRLTTVAGLTALLCGCMATTGATNMKQHFPPGAQDPKSPHPGTISAIFSWNNSTEAWTISDLPESFYFRCFDASGKPTARAHAAWCIPLVEVETVSVDENGKPVAPKDADSVSISEYGPGHTFIEHTQSVPHLKRQRELDRQDRTPPLESAKPSTSPQSFSPGRSNGTFTDYRQPLTDVKSSWWKKIKALVGLA
jgi:hypothetical protein